MQGDYRYIMHDPRVINYVWVTWYRFRNGLTEFLSFFGFSPSFSHIYMSRYGGGGGNCGGYTTVGGSQTCGCKLTLPTSGACGPAVCGGGNKCGGSCGTTSCGGSCATTNCGGCNSCPGTVVSGPCMSEIPTPAGGPPMMAASYPQTPKDV